ncbi:MAG: VWA domain-containing protein [Pseudomonadota bacterium]
MHQRRPIRTLLASAALIAGISLPFTAQAENTIIVLDASGSMWGQIDGISKIEIAREVLGDLLSDWDNQTPLGVVAYGHRREGDCTDIELVRGVGPVDPEALIGEINAIMPRGRTPLTDAVRQAAEELRYQDEPATVILLSDGIETCNADPCALSAELEQAGINFTAHVIGFDIAQDEAGQLSCIAENTGGTFLLAENAQQLSDALTTVTAAPPPQPAIITADITLRPIDAASGQTLSGVDWTVTDTVNGNNVVSQDGTGTINATLEEGTYLATAAMGDAEGQVTFSVVPEANATYDVSLERILPEATVSGPAQIPATATFEAQWAGPDEGGDYVTIVEAGAPRNSYNDYERTQSGNPLELDAPDGLGAYELRYVHGQSGETLASQPIELTPISATLSAVSEASSGNPIAVEWTGPNSRNDYITIVEAGAPAGTYNDYERTTAGSPLEINAPDGVGNYEIRYVIGQSSRTLASVPLTLVAATATLDAPIEALAGADIDIAWSGPDNQNDYITIVEAGSPEGTYNDYERTTAGSPVTVTAPDGIGNYEIRYVIGQSSRTLASIPLTLVAAQATLEAPSEVGAGAEVEVAWTGPDNRNDYITIVEVGSPEGTYNDYERTTAGSPVSITAPDAIGTFEIRYVVGQSGRTLASVPLTLVVVGATIEAPAEADAGASIEVTWDGPDNHNDYITIVEAGAPEGTYNHYERTRAGSPVTIRAPDAVGDHEIRYVVGQSGRTLHSVPISLTQAVATFDAPSEIGAGGNVEVDWTGPDNHNDYITIVEAGSPEGTYNHYERTRAGTPVTIRAPDGIGNYELRYVVGQSGRTLLSQPITLTPVSASLELLTPVVPGAFFEVGWEGPDNHNDFITIVEAGAPEGEYTDYERTRVGSPAELRAPEGLGNYEVRYVVGMSDRTLASLPVTLQQAAGSIEAPGEVPAGSVVEVSWTGPGAWEHFIEIVPAGAPSDASPLSETRTTQGSPLQIFAPAQPGDYEIRYRMRDLGEVLVSVPLSVK